MLSIRLTRRKRLFTFRLLYIGSLLICLSLFSSCAGTFSSGASGSSSVSNPTTALPEDLVVTGSLTVGSYTAYPPQESINQTNNTPVGFDIDLITAIAQHMSLKIKIVSTDFQHLISKLLTRNFDVAVSAIIITPELQQRVSFIPYFIGGESLLVMKGNPLRINGLQELCGLKVAVLASTLEQKDLEMATGSCEQEKKPAIQIIVLQDQTAVIQLLLNKQVAAAYQDSPVTDYFIKQYPEHFQVAGPVINANLEGIAIRKDDTVMFKAVQTAFIAVKTDGTYCSLIKKWGLTSGALIENNHRIC